MAGLMLLPATLALTISEPPAATSNWFRGRFGEIGRECRALMRSPRRKWGVLLLIVPGCTCAAQPLLPALASHYGTEASGVLWINGLPGGSLLAAGSLLGLLIPGDCDRRLTYAGAGFTNALGAIILLAPNRPFFYLAGTLVYLLTAGLCNARNIALMLDVVGPDINDVSTWYGALTAISQIPIASMIWLEGRMFHHFGLHGLLWTDAAGNLLVFAMVATLLLDLGSRKMPAAIVPTTKGPGSAIPGD